METLLYLFASSVIAIALLALLINWLHPNTHQGPITIETFKAALLDHDQQQAPGTLCLSTDAQQSLALLGKGPKLAIVRRVGDRVALRVLSITELTTRQAGSGQTKVSIHDFTWPSFQVEGKSAEQLAKWQTKFKEASHA
ncbi:MAG: hypothetical protein COA47_04295 [Robiginitomaculum sp.]|nr:MAG: hypothetical protein COA47_04295 [Robiginitomaculum sp.]